jgi:hypothetical protein
MKVKLDTTRKSISKLLAESEAKFAFIVKGKTEIGIGKAKGARVYGKGEGQCMQVVLRDDKFVFVMKSNGKMRVKSQSGLVMLDRPDIRLCGVGIAKSGSPGTESKIVALGIKGKRGKKRNKKNWENILYTYFRVPKR